MTEIKELISSDDIQNRVAELSTLISKDYAGKTLLFLCVLKGGVMFTMDLCRKIDENVAVELDFMDISSYGDSTESSRVIKINKDLSQPITGKNVLLCEDIIDSGRTLSYLMKYLSMQNPESLRICALLDKPSRRVNFDIIPDYIGFTVPNDFVVGYGLDVCEKHRNLNYIGVMI